eukprot:m.102500 g.102500  ORF g.102500 m.102500 type:complete len:979 (+) comp8827_c0_seq2:75-3011(+)
MDSAGQLAQLQQLLQEYYSPLSDNQRKKDIESVLQQFKAQPGVWRQAAALIELSTDQATLWYLCSVLEGVVTRAWAAMDAAERSQFRAFLYRYVTEKYSSLDKIVQAKVCKVFVTLGKIEWPEAFPEFLPSIFQLVQANEPPGLGMRLLLMCSEDLSDARGVPAARARALRGALADQIPAMLQFVADRLRQIASGPESSEMTSALGCIQHMFSWANLSQTVTPDVLGALFEISKLQCRTTAGSLAVGSLVELCQRNTAPPAFPDFVVQLFQHTAFLVQQLIDGGSFVYESLDDGFPAKVADLCATLVGTYMRRLYTAPGFPAVEFLDMLLKYALLPFHPLDVLLCMLDACGSFLEKLHDDIDGKPGAADRFQPCIQGFLTRLVARVQVTADGSTTDALLEDEDGEDSDRQRMLVGCTEIALHCAELFYDDAIAVVWPVFCRHRDTVLANAQVLGKGSTAIKNSMLDLATSAYVLCSMGSIYEESSARQATAIAVLESLAQCISVCEGLPAAPAAVQKLHGRLLRGVQALAYFLHSLAAAAAGDAAFQQFINSILSSAIRALPAPDPVGCHGSELLVALLSIARPPFITTLSSFTDLFQRLPSVLDAVPPAAAALLVEALAVCVLAQAAPAPLATSEAKFPYIEAIARTLLARYDEGPYANPARFIATLQMLAAYAKAGQSVPRAMRELLATFILPRVPAWCAVIQELAARQAGAEELLEHVVALHTALFSNLFGQLGADYLRLLMTTLTNALNRDFLSAALSKGAKALLLRQLDFARLAGGDASPAMRPCFPDLLRLLEDVLCPLLAATSDMEVLLALHLALRETLVNHWRDLEKDGAVSDVLIQAAFSAFAKEPDIGLMRETLMTFKMLDKCCLLYRKEFYKSRWRMNHLTAMLSALCNPFYSVLGEDLRAALFAVAAADMPAFHAALPPLTLSLGIPASSAGPLCNTLLAVSDAPSFSAALEDFARDVECYRSLQS